MFIHMSHSKYIQLVLLFSSLLTFHDLGHAADVPLFICDNRTTISNSFFEDNLGNLLIFLESYASTSKFYNMSTGNHPDTLYGLFLCYDYISNDDCKNCVTIASEHVRRRCPNGNEDVVWEDKCQLRYSTRRFFGELNLTGNVPLGSVLNISNPDQFRDFMNETLHNLSNAAAKNTSAMYATESVVFMPTSTRVYAFLQCTPDMSPDGCNACLVQAITDILDTYYYSIGARLLSRSCYLRYELYPLYVETAISPGSMPIPEGKPRKLKNQLMIAILVTGAAMLLFGLLIYCYMRKKKALMSRERHFDLQEIQSTELGEIDFQGENLQGHSLHPQDLPFYEINILSSATGNFSEVNKLGEGGFGPVYKGILPEGNEVAVKRLSGISEQGSDEFLTEAALIQRLQHKNLVRLLGFSTYGEEKLLIYEYMPNSSLDFFLIDPRKRAQLDWSIRLNIINGVARGILYLHQDSQLKIIHRDLKPSNVLLDKDMNPKISDFGNARIFASKDGEANTSKIAGTYGYMAPEFAMEGLYSIKSDMFSFGVLVLEIITGRQNFVGPHLSKHTPNLIANARQLWNEGKGEELMDPLLGDSCPLDEFLKCMHIGLMCVQEDPCDRPTMQTVAIMLNCETETPSQPARPAFTDGRFIDPRKRAQLDWSIRLNIINGVARGILYLYQDSRLKIIHRDLKPSNVLLDKDMNPKISDFGNARIFASKDGEANTSKIAGTYGYMAPEFAMEGLYSIKSDMWCSRALDYNWKT